MWHMANIDSLREMLEDYGTHDWECLSQCMPYSKGCTEGWTRDQRHDWELFKRFLELNKVLCQYKLTTQSKTAPHQMSETHPKHLFLIVFSNYKQLKSGINHLVTMGSDFFSSLKFWCEILWVCFPAQKIAINNNNNNHQIMKMLIDSKELKYSRLQNNSR